MELTSESINTTYTMAKDNYINVVLLKQFMPVATAVVPT